MASKSVLGTVLRFLAGVEVTEEWLFAELQFQGATHAQVDAAIDALLDAGHIVSTVIQNAGSETHSAGLRRAW